ncbi:unnamed protein product [Heterobilharzia americana]|nr:unnamed protein product [Heterobilharzia americana]
MTNRKRAPSRRVIVYRGSIMQRIIEEKRRQRTISVGSLDGMVITRDNELIAASKVMNYDKPLLDPTTVQRISETVARKIEAKLSSTVAPNLSNINEGAANGGVVVTSGGNSTIGSRTGLRVSLPQIVQEYIQSQLSLTLQQQQSAQPKLSSSISPLTNNSYQFTPTDQGIYPSMLPASKLSTANVSVHEFTVQPTSAVCDGSVTNLDGTVLSTTEHFFPADNVPVNQSNIPTSGSIMTVNFPAYLSGNATNAPVNFVPGILATTTTTPTVLGSGLSRRHPNHSVSENVSLRRTTSDASLESRFTSITGVDPSYAGIDILDDEIKADIQMLVRKEISRPQYKKDFFYTGSIRQMDPAKMAINHKLSINLPIVSNVERPNRSTASFRLPAGHFQSDIRPEHCSQTSLGVVNQFIPPAPCPPIPINQQPIVYSNPPIVGLSQFAVPSDNSMNQCSTNVYSDTVDSFLSQNNTEILDNLKSKTFNQSGDCEKVDYTRTSVNTNIQQQQPEEPLDYVVDGDVDDDVDMGIEDVEQDDDDDNDDDENNDGDLIDGQINDEDGLYTRCPKCFNRCNTCGNVLFCFSSCSPLETFMQDLLSPKLLSSLTFLFFLLSSMTAMLGLVIPFLMLPDLLAEMNMKLEDSGFIISSIGAGNTFGRLFATFYIEKAWSTTYKWADSLWMNNISLLLTALTVFALPVVTRYYAALVLVSCGFGLFSAVFVSLKSILVVELIGIDRLTNAFGYLLLFQGCAAIIGPPVAGYLRDARIDSLPAFNIFTAHTAPMHNASAIGFLFSGTALLVSCLLGCPLRWLSKREFSSLVANTNEYIPNHMDHTDYGYELNRTSPVILTTGGQDYVQLTNSNEYHLGGELMNSGKTEPGSGRRMDIVDHYVANPSTPSVTQMTVIDALRSQANSQLSPSAPPPSINCLPISGHVIFSTAPPPVASTLSGVVVGPAGTAATATGPLDNITVGTANVTVPVADDSVPMVTVGGLKLSAAVIPVSVVGGAGSVPNTGSLSLPPQTVEVLEVKEDPGLEPVVEEEEEEDYEDDTFDDGAIDQYTKDNNISLHHLDSVTTTMLVNNDSSIPTSESSFNQDTSDSTPMNDSSTSSSSTTAATHNTNSRKDNAKYKRRRTSKLSPPVVSSTVLDDKLNNEVGNDTTTDVTITSTTTTVTTVTSSDHGDNNTEEDDNNHPNVDKKNDDDHDDKDVHMS